MPEPGHELSAILARERAGDGDALEAGISGIYEELRRVAGRMMQRERAGHTLSPTAVVHEAVVRLLGEEVFDRGRDRDFLVAAAARAMREILVDHARRAGRRAAGAASGNGVPLDSVVDYFEGAGRRRRRGPRGHRPPSPPWTSGRAG